MMRKYIPIRSVDEIDVANIGLHNINNRYIDTIGNRYATRFNLRTHKIEIVQIVLGKEEARIFRENYLKHLEKQKLSQEVLSLKKNSDSENRQGAINVELPPFIKNLNLQTEVTDVEEMITGFPQMINSLIERLKGVLNNMKISQTFNDHKSQNGQDLILEVMSFFDHQVMEVLEATNDKLVELLKYPRPPTSYLSAFSHKQKKILDTWNPSMIMELVKAVTVGEGFFTGAEAALRLLDELQKVLLPEVIEKATGSKKQQLTDAKNTCEFLQKQVLADIQGMLNWWKTVYAIP